MQQIGDPDFDKFAKEAYASEEGFAFRTNQEGETEMFVAGTRTIGDWGLNLLDTAAIQAENKIQTTTKLDLHGKILSLVDPVRKERKRKIEHLIEDKGVVTVYGHSRGGAEVADLTTKARKVGLDAAMIEAENKEMLNLEEGGFHSGFKVTDTFDTVIGMTGQNNVYMDLDRDDFHQVWVNEDIDGWAFDDPEL